jgi:tRNA A-37 threonylcarbamoyl transferase component Bud32
MTSQGASPPDNESSSKLDNVGVPQAKFSGASSANKEDPSLQLLDPVPNEKLSNWLSEFYGKPVTVTGRELLRHRDLSRVERITLDDALPASLIYKQVLPPWDIEQDLHERILVPSLSNCPQLFMAAHHGPITALFMEDIGKDTLLDMPVEPALARRLGEELAKMHRSYSYRTDELMQLGVLRSLSPIDYDVFLLAACEKLSDWQLIQAEDTQLLSRLSKLIAPVLAGEPISLVHGDLYAENIVPRGNRIFIIDWSWFTMLSVPLLDVATITSVHPKNSIFVEHRQTLLEAYCDESGRNEKDTIRALPFAEALNRILFLDWLVERKSRGIQGTTVGPVDSLLRKVIKDLKERYEMLREAPAH